MNLKLCSKIIVIDGVDGTGKTTQCKLLIQQLKKMGLKTAYLHFPQHNKEVFGKIVDCYLNGDFGKADEVSPYLASALYALDRFEAQKKILKWKKQDKVIILDRYEAANKGHQAGKLIKKPKEIKKIFQFLDKMEFKVLKNIKPDLNLILTLNIASVKKLIAKKRKRRYIQGAHILDIHERDLKYLEQSILGYQKASQYYKDWQIIKCDNASGILKPEDIHLMIWQKIKSIF